MSHTSKTNMQVLYTNYSEFSSVFTEIVKKTSDIMKKVKKKSKILIILISALAVIFAGVYFFVAFYGNTDSEMPFYSASENVLFEIDNTVTEISSAELKNYSGRYSKYNNYIYYGNLSDSEKLIYKIYEYAFENCADSVYISESLTVNNSYNAVQILQFLSLDNPLVEQNFALKTSVLSLKNKNLFMLPFSGTAKTYTHLYISSFSKEQMNKKLKAIKEAEKIVASVPDGLSVKEKAEFLYKSVCKTTDYKDYGGFDGGVCYIYDAFINKKTHCDGFSNAISLLFNMSGIQCFEKASYNGKSETKKIFIRSENENESDYRLYETPSGHTWCCFNIDGVWYDADGTIDSKNKIESRNTDIIFGLGIPTGYFDEYADYDYKNILPQTSTEFLFKPHFSFNTPYDDGAEKLLYEHLANGKTDIKVIFQNADMDGLRELAKNICEYGDVSVYYGLCKSNPLTAYYALREKN